MFVFYLFQVRFSWISRRSWFPTRSAPFSVNSLSACISGAFIPGVTAVQCHSPRAVIPLYHPTPSNSRNARCTPACTGVKNKWGTKVFCFPSSLFCTTLAVSLPLLVVDQYFTLTFASTLQCPQKPFGTKEILLMLLQFYKPNTHASTVPSPQKLWENKDLII